LHYNSMDRSQGKNIVDIQYSLEKNLKELQCLHEVTRISGAPEKTIAERLEEIVKILPMAFSQPENIWAHITNGNLEFMTDNYQESGHIISADIIVQREKTGSLEVGYTGITPGKDPALIDRQGILLIDTIAERLGSIIEHCRSQEALRESEEKFSKAFRLSPAGIVITSLENGRLIEVNDIFLRLAGFTHDEALKLSTTDIGIWQNKEERSTFLRKVIESSGVYKLEKIARIKGGEQRNVLVSADIINLDSKPCVITVVQDITEEKQSREFMESVSRASPMAIYVIFDRKIKYASPQFQMITGYNREELWDKDLLDIVPEADKDVVNASSISTLKGEKSYPCEYRIIQKNGRVRWVMQMIAPIHYQHKDAILGSLMDITERKYLERKVVEYEELDKLKGDILATVSHELRTPLAAIKGYATMMLDYGTRITADESMEYLISINNSADKLIKLVNNLMDTSRLDSGMLEMKKSTTSITALIKSVVKTTSLPVRPHLIKTNLPASLPRIDIDKKRITQVLENLIFNAARYSPPDTEILITAVKKRRAIEVSVTDHGAVIPPNELKNIFDRMYKIEKREYSGADGMGLGLHICQRLVEAHGGAIRAESGGTDGTTIRFTLPIMPHNKRNK
jgi:PAS domain S-box-containing protein